MNLRLARIGTLVIERALAAWLCCLAVTVLAADKNQDAAPPTFSVSSGVYADDLKLELSAGQATIRFSTDGTEPTVDSSIYKKPLAVTKCMVVRARAFYSERLISPVVSQSYVVLAEELRKFSSPLPLVVVNSCAGEIEPAEKSFASLHVLENKKARTTLSGSPDLATLALVNVRGHSSLRYPKHSYSVKTVNEFREAHKISVLDLPKESDWVLYAPYPDKTLLRDVLAYELSNKMGDWAPHTRFVEVFVNESGSKLTMENYAGVYVFEEKIVRGKSRVDIAKLEPGDNRAPEITGGYIFKKDHSGRGERKGFGEAGPPQAALPTDRTGYPTQPGGFPGDPAGFLPSYSSGSTTRTSPRATGTRAAARLGARNVGAPRPVTNYVAAAVPEAARMDSGEIFSDEESFRTILQRNVFYYHEPEPDEITAVQRTWLKDYLNRFEATLYGPDFADVEKGYAAFIERDSFIDYHLLSEMTKNVDAFRFSTFFHKDRGGRVKMGPVWDWNLSFGNADGKQGYMSEHWLWPQLDDQQYSWFRRLFDDPDFGQRYVDRWAQLRTNVFATANVLARIDALAAQLDEPQKRNFKRWPIIGRDVNPNWFVGNSYQEEIDWMKEWTSKRLDWIEAQFPPAPSIARGPKITLSTTNSEAKIYFTLDGTDPRAAGGAVSPAARVYESSVAVANNAKLFARLLTGTRWSALAILP